RSTTSVRTAESVRRPGPVEGFDELRAKLGAFFSSLLHVESEEHNIGFFNDVILAFETEQSFLFHLRFRSAGHEIVIGIDLGADESSLHVRMNFARRLWGREPFPQRPGSRLRLA